MVRQFCRISRTAISTGRPTKAWPLEAPALMLVHSPASFSPVTAPVTPAHATATKARPRSGFTVTTTLSRSNSRPPSKSNSRPTSRWPSALRIPLTATAVQPICGALTSGLSIR